jgi:hypothetical protein
MFRNIIFVSLVGWYSGNAGNLYLRGAWFKSWMGLCPDNFFLVDFEGLCSLVFRIPNDGQSPKTL